jgi:rhodanese-related sulfurtransferase
MHARKSRLPQLTLLVGLVLIVVILDSGRAEAMQAWDAAQATQGLVVLGGFTLVLIVGLALLARTMAKVISRPRIDVVELRRRLDAGEDLVVLDVRTPTDFVGEQGHIAEATNIPLEELGSRLDELGGVERPVALVCRTDRRSDEAAALLARGGFRRVVVVQGGMTAWLANGWPVEDAGPARR